LYVTIGAAQSSLADAPATAQARAGASGQGASFGSAWQAARSRQGLLGDGPERNDGNEPPRAPGRPQAAEAPGEARQWTIAVPGLTEERGGASWRYPGGYPVSRCGFIQNLQAIAVMA